jgi:hypothetical protein
MTLYQLQILTSFTCVKENYVVSLEGIWTKRKGDVYRYYVSSQQPAISWLPTADAHILHFLIIWLVACSGVSPAGQFQPVGTLQEPVIGTQSLCLRQVPEANPVLHSIIIHLQTESMYYTTCDYTYILRTLLPRTAVLFKRKFSETKYELTELTLFNIPRTKLTWIIFKD